MEKKPANEKRFHRYLENDKGDLVDVLGLVLFRPSPQEQLLVYPVLEVRLQCRYPEMCRQMLRYLSFSCQEASTLPPTLWPSRLVEEGYFFNREFGRVVCFFCDQVYRCHLAGCLRHEMNIRNGVQARPPVALQARLPVTMQELSSTGLLQIRNVLGVVDSNSASDLSLDVLSQRCRPPSDNDHDVHPALVAGRSNAGVPVPLQPADRGCAANVRQRAVVDVHTRSASSNRRRERESRGVAGTSSPLVETTSDHPLSRAATTQQSVSIMNVIEDRRPLCKACNMQPVTTKFLPCGHVVCCMFCAIPQQRCPLCDRRVRTVEEM